MESMPIIVDHTILESTLSFGFNQMDPIQPSMDLQNLQPPMKKKRRLQADPKVSASQSRRTRSQVDPDWSLEEMLTLVSEITAIESDFHKALPSYQKWKMIADNCNSFGIMKSLNQCRRKWNILLDEYKKIKDWDIQSEKESYWDMESETKTELGLSVSFERELFELIDEHWKETEDQSSTDGDADSDLDVKMDSGPKPKRRRQHPQVRIKRTDKDTVAKLREQAELIHAILRKDPAESVFNSFDDQKDPVASQIEFKRWQGNELIKVFGGLAGVLDQVVNTVQENM